MTTSHFKQKEGYKSGGRRSKLTQRDYYDLMHGTPVAEICKRTGVQPVHLYRVRNGDIAAPRRFKDCDNPEYHQRFQGDATTWPKLALMSMPVPKFVRTVNDVISGRKVLI